MRAVAFDAGAADETLELVIGLGELAAAVPAAGELAGPVGQHHGRRWKDAGARGFGCRHGNCTQYLSSTGCTSRTKLKPRAGPCQGSIADGARRAASAGRLSETSFCGSWQPAQDTASPGMPTNQLRMSCSAWPCSSSGCSDSGELAGILKCAEPSGLDRHGAEDAL